MSLWNRDLCPALYIGPNRIIFNIRINHSNSNYSKFDLFEIARFRIIRLFELFEGVPFSNHSKIRFEAHRIFEYSKSGKNLSKARQNLLSLGTSNTQRLKSSFIITSNKITVTQLLLFEFCYLYKF